MQNITVTYRTTVYPMDIDSTRYVPHLKEKVNELTGIKINNFDLKLHNFVLAVNKKIEDYTKDGTNFEMVDVTIDVNVALNGSNLPFAVKESEKIKNFIENIITTTNHSYEISLLFDKRELSKSDTILSSGVTHNASLVAINGPHIARVSIQYREDTYTININKNETVPQLKERVSKLTSIMTENFSLQQDNIYLSDHKKVASYMENGITYRMVNVTIRIFAAVNGILNPLYVNESMTINELMKTIMDTTGVTDEMTLHYHTGELVGTKTVLESGIKHRYVVIAAIEDANRSKIQTLTVTYRDESYNIDIDTSKTVLDVKKAVSKLTDLKENNFFLQFRWINYEDSKPISEYLKYGRNSTLYNVTINVTVKFEGKTYNFNVKEEMKVGDFIKIISERTGVENVAFLIYDDAKLNGDLTLLESKVLHNHTLLALSGVTGG